MDIFNSKYSNSPSSFIEENKKQQFDRLSRIVLSFNENLKKEVKEAKDKYNLKVRGVIADKTGLSLSYQSDSYKRKSEIPIYIVDRVPLSILKLFNNYNDNQIGLTPYFLDRFNKMI